MLANFGIGTLVCGARAAPRRCDVASVAKYHLGSYHGFPMGSVMPARTETRARVLRGGAAAPPVNLVAAEAQPPLLTLGLYALAFLLPAWPWVSGAFTIPWDAESQFRPQLSFLARSLATGQSPFWTPNVFGGWPP